MKKEIQNLLEVVKLHAPQSWDCGFLESICEQVTVGKVLSSGQIYSLDKIRDKYSPEAIKEQQEWKDNYSSKHRAEAVKVAKYYKANPPYFERHVQKILSDPDGHFLTKREWNKMIDNKYSKKVRNQYDAPDKYILGQLVQFRKHKDVPPVYRDVHGVILKANAKPIITHANGSKIYQVLPVGAAQPIYIRECAIKKVRKKCL